MIILELLRDLFHGTSHSVRFLSRDEQEVTLSKAGIHIRKAFAPMLRAVYSTQTAYKIVTDSRVPLSRSKTGRIFAINHRQADDIVIGANAVNRSAYIVFGNPYLVFETTNGLGLWAYGLILLYRDRKSSRTAAYEKMRFVLQHRGNVIIYPEGYWNLDDDGSADELHKADGHNSETRFMQDINIGVIRLAQETGCEIVPVALHYDEYKKACYTRRGCPMKVCKTDDIFTKKDELVDSMQTMLYELMEKYSSYERDQIEKEKPLSAQWAELKAQLKSACDIPKIGYKLDLKDEKRIGKAKVVHAVTLPAEAYAHLSRINPTPQNAFLWSKSAHIN